MEKPTPDTSPNNPESMAGQALARARERLSTLETSFKVRLGEEVSVDDQIGALSDLSTFLANEAITLWQMIEVVLRRLGDEGPFEVETRE
jgi:hypothetical protein